MRAVLYQYGRLMKRHPLSFLGSLALTILFAAVLGSGGSSQLEVPVYTEDMTPQKLTDRAALFSEELENFTLTVKDEEAVEQQLRTNNPPYALLLNEHTFSMLEMYEAPEVAALEASLIQLYAKEQLLSRGAEAAGEEEAVFAGRVQEEGLGFQVTSGEEDAAFQYDPALHPLFGFSLFFVIYSISISLSTIVRQRQEGTWDRIILSPLSKVQLYAGHLLFAFCFGMGQLLIIFLLFRFLFQVDFHGGFIPALLVLVPYVLAVVSLGVLLSGLVRTYRQLDAVIPLVSVSIAMLGGAFWPLEIVTSEILQQAAGFVPLKHGMDLLIGVTYGAVPLSSTMLSVSILLLMSVIFIGLGLNLMERR
ncbi:ABC transporter permease [Alkalicoccus halolimnae]|uniref:ABC transporter permease n=1 Tax=Alkalicoccus halolimnae TaxID=1667239 RepID=A0A5C7F382_9BACI|nr:ABC transporter permease [Alkalicoccus halolimnae]TXF83563.1 ABC transporter permease [Alkalicoccus halolimnae]